MVGLFSIIPIDITIQFLKDWLEVSKIETNKINELLNLTKLCMSQNVFPIQNRFFE